MKYYVYLYRLQSGRVAYIGKGCGKRDLGEKNPDFELVRHLLAAPERVEYFETERAAYSFEGELIEKYNPAYNISRGLSKPKWDGIENYVPTPSHFMAMYSAQGADSVTPAIVCDVLPRSIPVDAAVMFVGDRFSAMLKTFQVYNPDHAGQIIVVQKFETGHLALMEEAMNERYMDNVEPENKDFLTTPLPMVDYVFMNPPFNDNQWKAFLLKARSLARIGVYALLPHMRGENIGVEHTVLVDRVEFATAKRYGMAVYIAHGASVLKHEKLVCKWDVDIVKSSYLKPLDARNVVPTVPFFGISREKRIEKDFGVRLPGTLTNDEQEVYIITGKDLDVLAPLLIAGEQALHNYKTEILKAKGGKQIHFSMAQLVLFLNTL